MSGRPRSSTGTVPDHCELQATPATRPGSNTALAEDTAGPAHDRVPPVGGVLLDPAAPEDVQRVPLDRGGDQLAPEGGDGDLQPRGPEIEGQEVADLRHAAKHCTGQVENRFEQRLWWKLFGLAPGGVR